MKEEKRPNVTFTISHEEAVELSFLLAASKDTGNKEFDTKMESIYSKLDRKL